MELACATHVQGRKGPYTQQDAFLLLPSRISSLDWIRGTDLAPGTHLGLTWQVTVRLQANVGWLECLRTE